jgi:hypothetical protein
MNTRATMPSRPQSSLRHLRLSMSPPIASRETSRVSARGPAMATEDRHEARFLTLYGIGFDERMIQTAGKG